MPGKRCAVAACNNSYMKTKDMGILYHTFPRDPVRRKQWVQCCQREENWNPATGCICSIHFDQNDYQRDLKSELLGLPPKRILKPTAVPSLLLENTSFDFTTLDKINESVHQIVARDSKSKENEQCSIENQGKYARLLADYNILKLQHNELKTKYERKVRSMEGLIRYYKSKNKNIGDMEQQLHETLKSVFTANQIKCILKKGKKVNWNDEEMAIAFTLNYYSKQCYAYLRENLKYPLPKLSSVRKWVFELNMREGILHDVLKLMRLGREQLSDLDRSVVIQFDQVKIESLTKYDNKLEETVSCSQMQVIMVRSLFSTWKQPVYVSFGRPVHLEILFEIIRSLEEIGYNVWACVSSCDSENIQLWEALDININQPYFKNPANNNNIYAFVDPSLSLNLLRNCLLDCGFTLEGGRASYKAPLEETNVSCKVSTENAQGEERVWENIPLGVELLCHKLEFVRKLAEDFGNFVDIINNWFKVFSSYTPNDPNHLKSAYGVHLKEQNKALTTMIKMMENMLPMRRTSIQMFQQDIVISSISLQMLYNDLKRKYNISSISTHKLNRDALDNFICEIRSLGGPNDYPTPLNIFNRIRTIILGEPSTFYCDISKNNGIHEEYLVTKVVTQVDDIIPNQTSETSESDCSGEDEMHGDLTGITQEEEIIPYGLFENDTTSKKLLHDEYLITTIDNEETDLKPYEVSQEGEKNDCTNNGIKSFTNEEYLVEAEVMTPKELCGKKKENNYSSYLYDRNTEIIHILENEPETNY